MARWMVAPFIEMRNTSRTSRLRENEFSFRLISMHHPCRDVQDMVGYMGLVFKKVFCTGDNALGVKWMVTETMGDDEISQAEYEAKRRGPGSKPWGVRHLRNGQ